MHTMRRKMNGSTVEETMSRRRDSTSRAQQSYEEARQRGNGPHTGRQDRRGRRGDAELVGSKLQDGCEWG